MTTAILILCSVTFGISVIMAVMCAKVFKYLCALCYGFDQVNGVSLDCYSHLNYTNSALKLMLDDLEDRNNEKLNEAVHSDNFEMASYYKKLGESIVQLKTMSNEDIEASKE